MNLKVNLPVVEVAVRFVALRQYVTSSRPEFLFDLLKRSHNLLGLGLFVFRRVCKNAKSDY